MKRIIACLAGILSLSAVDVCLAAAPSLQEGMWETTMETTMEGLPFAIPPTVVKTKQCLTKKDMVPKDENQKDCTISKQKISGNKATWEFECNQDGTKMTGKGEVTYTGSSSSGTSTSHIVSEGQKMTAVTKFKGKRLGPCTGEKDSMEVNGQDVDKMKEQFNEVMEQKQQIDAQMEAARQKSVALIEKIRIPAEKPDACEHKSGNKIVAAAPARQKGDGDEERGARSSTTACDERLGPLAIKAGEWEITTETTSKTTIPVADKTESKPKKKARAKAKEKEKVKEEDRVMYGDVSSETKTKCLSPEIEPLVGEQMKRSGNTVTWKSTEKNSYMNDEQEGGVEYRGNSFEGGVIRRQTSSGSYTTNYARVTGKRLGDGNCVSKGRESSSKPLSDSPGEVIDQSTRKLKSLFGF